MIWAVPPVAVHLLENLGIRTFAVAGAARVWPKGAAG